MQNKFIKKRGAIIKELAQYLVNTDVGERLPIISDFQEMFSVSRGTVQNALDYLKEAQIIEVASKGHLGSFIVKIDKKKLLELAIDEFFFGTMPLPYSKNYEGLATACNILFKLKNIRLNMAYVRGSSARIAMVENDSYQFAITSLFAAKEAIKENGDLEIIINFGPKSYLSHHVVLSNEKNKKTVISGERVGIDLNSIDQKELTTSFVGDTEVEYIDLPGHQMIHGIKEGMIDVGIWNFDEIADKQKTDIYYREIEDNPISVELSTAVIISLKSNIFSRKILTEVLTEEEVLKIQKQVKDGQIIPQY